LGLCQDGIPHGQSCHHFQDSVSQRNLHRGTVMAKREPKLTPEQHRLQQRECGLRDARKYHIPFPPAHRIWKVGDRVKWGGHPNTEVLEVFDGGKFYYVRAWGTYSEYGRPVEREQFHVSEWTELFPDRSREECSLIPSFIDNTDIDLNYSHMSIDSCISTYYHFGINMNPEYQRDYVWNDEDRVELIDSIFCNRNIGTYVLIHMGYGEGCGYEILDGKQRIRALLDFYEDKFTYKGRMYSELRPGDQHHFDSFAFPRAEVRARQGDGLVPLEMKIKIFLHVNNTGKVMDKEHLEKVKAMLK